jgi:hypothetical protein
MAPRWDEYQIDTGDPPKVDGPVAILSKARLKARSLDCSVRFQKRSLYALLR